VETQGLHEENRSISKKSQGAEGIRQAGKTGFRAEYSRPKVNQPTSEGTLERRRLGRKQGDQRGEKKRGEDGRARRLGSSCAWVAKADVTLCWGDLESENISEDECSERLVRRHLRWGAKKD